MRLSATLAWSAAVLISLALLAMPLVAFGATASVTIQSFQFRPPTVTVRAGDTVSWTNVDATLHTSTSDTALWDTGNIAQGTSRTVTFALPGTFTYHCSNHSAMQGIVIVQAAATPVPTPPPTPVPTAPPTPQPTVRTPAPTPVTTAPLATPQPTPVPTPEPTPLPTPSPTPTPTPESPATGAPASPSQVAAVTTPAPLPNDAGPGPLIVAGAAVAVLGLGALAWALARRT